MLWLVLTGLAYAAAATAVVGGAAWVASSRYALLQRLAATYLDRYLKGCADGAQVTHTEKGEGLQGPPAGLRRTARSGGGGALACGPACSTLGSSGAAAEPAGRRQGLMLHAQRAAAAAGTRQAAAAATAAHGFCPPPRRRHPRAGHRVAA